MDPKYTWEIIGIYRAPNDDVLEFESSAARNVPTRKLTKRNIIGCDLNLGDVEKASGIQTI
jgi:hypothetical protein